MISVLVRENICFERKEDAADREIITAPYHSDMKIRYNENEDIVKTIKEGLKRRNGHCPCRLEENDDTKCMCREFREQMADPNFEGYCHCYLYYKEK